MSTLKVSNFARQGYSIVFPLFLFFSAIFCMSTRTNNLLHLSILLLLLSLVRQENRQALAGVLREQWQTWTLLAAFFIYYALSNVWGHTPQHIDSPITHGVYLTGYLLLMTMLLRDGRTRRLAMLAVVGGITVLSLWTLIIDHTLVLTERAVSPENPGPTNVIDLAGYCGIGILICGMLLKEKASHWLYLPVVIMLVMLLLTQSRGPIIALVLAVGCTLHLHVFTRRNLLIAAALAVLVALLLVMTPVGDMLLARFEELGTQSGLRLSIWHHTLSEMASQPWLGRGFSYELDFINYSGEHITTTHSVYMGALLKGGIVGLLLLLAIIGLRAMAGVAQAPYRQPLQSGDPVLRAGVYGLAGDVYHQQSPGNLGAVLAAAGHCAQQRVGGKTLTKRAVSGPFYINFLNQLRAATSRSACSLITGHTDSIATSATFASSQTICFALS